MRKVIRFAIREYRAAVKTKGFIIGLILAPIMMSGGMIAFILLKDRVDTTDKHVAVLDHTKVVAEALIDAAKYHNENETLDKETGEKVAREHGIELLYADLRKRYSDSRHITRPMDLYRQQYCGCLYSELERYSEEESG